MKTKSQEAASDVAALLRARNPLIWIVSREEARVERCLFEAAGAANYMAWTWDVAQGFRDVSGKPPSSAIRDLQESQDPGRALTCIEQRASGAVSTADRGVWIMRDLPAWLSGPGGVTTLRQLRNLARLLPTVERAKAQAIIVLSTSATVPDELSAHATVIEWPLPDRAEVAGILDAAIEALPEELQKTAAPNGTREAAIDAAIGLSGEEAAACYARSLVQLRSIDPALVAKEKRRVIARERVLEWYDPLPGGLDAVGGLENLKAWLLSRSTAYTPKAREYGLPAPRGAMLVGVPGCGKSLTAKAIATAWGVPLLRLDLGALKSKFVGDSEQNLRKAFKVIEAIGRCVVWLDEIEKALAGATDGSADGGVSSDALGGILSWMQERPGEAFVIATANAVDKLPPELLRKGRFDEVWFIDLPNDGERSQILSASLNTFKRSLEQTSDWRDVIALTKGFTGSEIAALVPDAMFAAFADDAREIQSLDLIRAAKTVVPLSRTAAEKIETLRAWAKDRARVATRIEEEAPAAKQRAGRQIDVA